MTIDFNIIWLIKILYLLSWYILIPGLALNFILNSKTSFIEKIGNSFAFGFVVFSILSFCAYFFAWNFKLINVSYYFINLGLILFAFIQNRKKIKIMFSQWNWKNINTVFLIIISISILGFIISLFSGWYPRGDAAIHLQVIKNILNQGFVTQPFYSLIGNPIMPDHAYDSYYILIALISKYSGMELSVVWHYLSPVLSLLLPFTLYSFLKSLTKDKKLIVFSLIGFYLIAGFYPLLMYGTVYDALVYPNRVYLWLILPISFTFVFKFFEENKILHLLIASIICSSQIFIHQSGFIFFFLLLGGLLCLSFFNKYKLIDKKKVIISIITTIIVSLPIILLKFKYNIDYIKESSTEIWHQHYDFYNLNSVFYSFRYNPPYKIITILSLLFVVFQLITIKRKKHKLFILVAAASFITVNLIVYNPFIVPFLGKLISYVAIGRMLRLSMYFLVMGLAIYYLYLYLQKITNIKNNKLYRYIIAIMLLIVLSATGIKIYKRHCKHEILAVNQFCPLLKENSIILSDIQTSTDIIEFANVRSVTMQFNGASDLINIDKEKEDVSRLLTEEISIINAEEILDKYSVDYIIIDKEKVMPKINFIAYEEKFTEIYNDNNYIVIECLDLK